MNDFMRLSRNIGQETWMVGLLLINREKVPQRHISLHDRYSPSEKRFRLLKRPYRKKRAYMSQKSIRYRKSLKRKLASWRRIQKRRLVGLSSNSRGPKVNLILCIQVRRSRSAARRRNSHRPVHAVRVWRRSCPRPRSLLHQRPLC